MRHAVASAAFVMAVALMTPGVLYAQDASANTVVDQTGLKGRYDFNLRWAVDDGAATAADAPPGLFTAIQEQIGLKLEPVKAPADVLVIDKLEKPGAN